MSFIFHTFVMYPIGIRADTSQGGRRVDSDLPYTFLNQFKPKTIITHKDKNYFPL
jgi:hypothetical protein